MADPERCRCGAAGLAGIGLVRHLEYCDAAPVPAPALMLAYVTLFDAESLTLRFSWACGGLYMPAELVIPVDRCGVRWGGFTGPRRSSVILSTASFCCSKGPFASMTS